MLYQVEASKTSKLVNVLGLGIKIMYKSLQILFASLFLAHTTDAAIIAFNDFDSSLNLINSDISGPNGFYDPNDRFDIWGVTDRATAEAQNASDLLDDSALNGIDTFGIIKSNKTDRFFASSDIVNSFGGTGIESASWTFDISGASSLSLAIDMAAIGDFESGDFYSFSVAIDEGPSSVIFDSSSFNSGVVQDYVFEAGTTNSIIDPLVIGGVTLTNDFQTLVSALIGEGDELTLQFNASGVNGSSELFIFDNIVLEGELSQVPLPAAAWLLISGLVGVSAFRPRK